MSEIPPLPPTERTATESSAGGETNLADFIRDQVCCPRIHGCELGGADECPAERVRCLLEALNGLTSAIRTLGQVPELAPTARQWQALIRPLHIADEAIAKAGGR